MSETFLTNCGILFVFKCKEQNLLSTSDMDIMLEFGFYTNQKLSINSELNFFDYSYRVISFEIFDSNEGRKKYLEHIHGIKYPFNLTMVFELELLPWL